MDNQTIDVTSEGREGILHALSIIWNAAAPGGRAKHYRILKLKERTEYYQHEARGERPAFTTHHTATVESPDGCETLILLWNEETGSTPLPYPLTREQAAGFIADWLGTVGYGDQPDHDGSNGRGWRLFTGNWGHVAGHHYAIIGVQPAWAMYGK